jgi:hypothetical protein
MEEAQIGHTDPSNPVATLSTAAAIHWFNDTPASFASRWAAFLMERGSFNTKLGWRERFSTPPTA